MSCNRWMIDIEGLGKMPGGVVLSIGWVRFSRQGVNAASARESRLAIQPQLDAGLKVHGDTIDWWLTQTAQPWAKGQAAEYPAIALDRLRADLSNADEVWAKPPSYDLAALEHLGEVFGINNLWSMRKPRCFRTLKVLAPAQCHLPKLKEGVKHGALVDAIHQAEEAVLMINHYLAG